MMLGKDKNALAQRCRGELAFQCGYTGVSLDNFNASLKGNPNDTWTLYCRGATNAFLCHYELALPDLQKSLQIYPKNIYSAC